MKYYPSNVALLVAELKKYEFPHTNQRSLASPVLVLKAKRNASYGSIHHIATNRK